jgi:hypothetical protein
MNPREVYDLGPIVAHSQAILVQKLLDRRAPDAAQAR